MLNKYTHFFIVIFFITITISLVLAFDVMPIGVIKNVETEKQIAFYNWLKDTEKYDNPSSDDTKKPKWAKEIYGFEFRNFFLVCFETIKDHKKKCEVNTQYSYNWREKNYAGVSNFEYLFGNNPFQYTRKFEVDSKNKIETSFYTWVKENTYPAPSKLPKDVSELHYVKFKELAFVCWTNKNDSKKYCEIDKL